MSPRTPTCGGLLVLATSPRSFKTSKARSITHARKLIYVQGAAGGRHGSEEEDAVGKRAAQQAKKLRELEVQGLAAFDEDSATFNVCGSTGEMPNTLFWSLIINACITTQARSNKLNNNRPHAAGNTYTVTLSNGKPHCSCPDHRFRRHDCKHIKLVLAKLRIQRRPKDWFEVRSGTGGRRVSYAWTLTSKGACQKQESYAVFALLRDFRESLTAC